MISKIKDTLLSNISLQIASILIFLVLPQILSVEEFAVTVFISVLLGFLNLSDAGFLYVYSRVMPVLNKSGSKEEIERWDATAFWMVVVSTFVLGLFFALLSLDKYGLASNSVFIPLATVLMGLTSFYAARLTAASNFSDYRNLLILQSCLRLLSIPLALAFGLLGWFASLVSSGAAGLWQWLKAKTPSAKHFDFSLVKTHFFEGLMLIIVFIIWNQMSALGRLIAVFTYEKPIIAQYGLFTSAYQLLFTLIAACYIPFSVYTLANFLSKPEQTVEAIFKVAIYSLPLISVLICITYYIAQPLFELIFVKYQYSPEIFLPMIFGLVSCPILLTLGNVFIAQKKTTRYVVIQTISLLIAFIYFITQAESQAYAAANAQMVALFSCGFLMLIASFDLYQKSVWYKLRMLIFFTAFWLATYIFLYWFVL